MLSTSPQMVISIHPIHSKHYGAKVISLNCCSYFSWMIHIWWKLTKMWVNQFISWWQTILECSHCQIDTCWFLLQTLTNIILGESTKQTFFKTIFGFHNFSSDKSWDTAQFFWRTASFCRSWFLNPHMVAICRLSLALPLSGFLSPTSLRGTKRR